MLKGLIEQEIKFKYNQISMKKSFKILHLEFNGSAQIHMTVQCKMDKWWPQSLSKLPPIIFYMKLTHLGSEASNYQKISVF